MECPSSWWPVHCARAKLIWQKSSSHSLLIAADLSKCKRCTQVLSSDKWAEIKAEYCCELLYYLSEGSLCFVIRLINVAGPAFCSQRDNGSFSPLWVLSKVCELPPTFPFNLYDCLSGIQDLQNSEFEEDPASDPFVCEELHGFFFFPKGEKLLALKFPQLLWEINTHKCPFFSFYFPLSLLLLMKETLEIKGGSIKMR